MDIAFIANGETALHTKTGNKIDKCDIVVRLGLYETNQFEEYVGTRTTIYGTARWKYIPRSPDLTLWMVEEIPTNYDEELRDMLNYDSDPTTKSKTFDTYRPTIGTRFLHKVLKEFKNDTIYVKGFDFFTTGHYFNPNHLYSNCSHPIVLERLLFLKLIKNKIIQLI